MEKWAPLTAAVVAIVAAVLSRLTNRDTQQVNHDLGVAKEQREGWSALLTSKDAEIARLNGRVEAEAKRADRAEGRLLELADADHALAERDAIIAALVARLGPTPEDDKQQEVAPP